MILTRIVVPLLALTACVSAQPGRAGESLKVSLVRATKLGATVWKPWELWRIDRHEAPAADLYVARTDEKKPVVLLVQGSHCWPLFNVMTQNGKTRFRSPFFFKDAPDISNQVHFAVVEKRGIKSFTSIPTRYEEGHCTDSYGGLSKQERVQDTVDGALALLSQPWVKELVLVGHSEGADVVAGAVNILGKRVTAAGLFAGAGASRFFDYALIARRANDDAAVKSALDDLLALATSPDGGTYHRDEPKRDLSYAVVSTPLEDLRNSSVPIFVAAGTSDHKKAPIESADLFVVEMLRSQPNRRLRYVMLPGLDHDFVSEQGEDRSPDVLRAFISWATDPNRRTEINVGVQKKQQ